MMPTLAVVVIVLAGLYLVLLGLLALVAPGRARAFLLGFVGSPWLHYAEMGCRIAVGAALLVHAPRTGFAPAFVVAGWLLLGTSGLLLLLPWRWHQRFARWSVPRALPYIGLIGVSSLLLGGLLLVATLDIRP